MTRTMADTIHGTVGDINALEAHQAIELVAGYTNGSYAWTADDWARFPKQSHVTIDVNGSNPAADVLDVEPGDATPNDSAAWVRNKLLQHPSYPPILYVNRSNITAVFNAQAAAGHKIVRDFRLWVATLDGSMGIPDMTGVTAIQYASSAMTHTNVDLSLVFDGAFKPVGPTPPPPPPHVQLPVPTISSTDADRIAGSVLYMLRFIDPSQALPAGQDVDSKLIADSAGYLRTLLRAFEASQDAKLLARLNEVMAALKLPPLNP